VRRRVPAIVLPFLLLAASCASKDEPPALESCPQGDASWRRALEAAASPQDLAALRTRLTAIASTCPDRWEPAWAAGECLFRTDRAADSRADFEKALGNARALGDATGIACASNRLGAIDMFAGDLASGEKAFAEALDAATKAKRRDLEAFIRNNLAGLLVEKGDYARARDELGIAADELSRLTLPDAARGAAYNRGVLLLELGDAFGAEAALKEVLRDAESAKDSWTVDAAAVVLGNLHLALDQDDEAASWYAKVSEEEIDLRAQAEIGLGRIALRRQRLAEAKLLLASAVKRAQEQERLFALIAETFLAAAEAKGGDVRAAKARLVGVIEESDRQSAEESSWAARWILGTILLDEKRQREAIPHLEKAVAILEREREHLDPLAEGMRFLRERAEPYVALAAALASEHEEGRTDRVLEVTRRAKARSLDRAASSASRTAARDARSIRTALGPGEILVDYLLGRERGVLVALTRDGERVVQMRGWDGIAADVRALRTSYSMPSEGTPERRAREQRLGSALLAPVADLLTGARRLYVVPDGELSLLPFGALPDPADTGKSLQERIDLAFLPLAGPPPKGPWQLTPVLVGASPESAPGEAMEDLPWSAYEASKIREAWGPARATLLLAGEYTLDAIRKADLLRFRTLHLASHAVASTVDPKKCGVILSKGEMLGVDAVRKLRMNGSLVVLSGCRTGEGELIPGEGIVGLGWSFLVAGANAVVASRWSVDDAVSARLMVSFHRALASGADPVEALGRASRETAREHPDPAYWAPFAIVLRPG
jgi:CHAT domain-containing protein/tetratricopeptide (TPR) repeat protein